MKKEAKNNTTPQLFEVVENCEIYEEVQEYLDEFGTRDWGEFIYHETRWKADIIDKGKWWMQYLHYIDPVSNAYY